MARSSEKNYYTHPDLGLALRYLREVRSWMTRKQLVEQVEGLSLAYLRKLENGERTSISRQKLEDILAALHISTQFFQEVLEGKPWQHIKPLPPRENRLQIGAEYREAAEKALADIQGTETWSTQVIDPTIQARTYGQVHEIMERYLRMTETEKTQLLEFLRTHKTT